MYPYMLTRNASTGVQTLNVAFEDNNLRSLTSDNVKFNEALSYIRDDDSEGMRDLFGSLGLIAGYALQLEGVSIEDDRLMHNGEELPAVLSKRIRDMKKQNLPVDALIAFWDNLRANPTPATVDELYQFLEQGVMPLTEDGCFLAYKYVNGDYTDCYSGTFDNSVGAVVSMPRFEVDSNRNRTCSRGLHFGALSYMPTNGGTRIMVVKVNPADVVAIPTDYNFTKGRTWKYEVVAEYTGASSGKEVTNKVVVSDLENDLDLDNGVDLMDEDWYDGGYEWWNDTPDEIDEEIDKRVYGLTGKTVSYYHVLLEHGPISPSDAGRKVVTGDYVSHWTGRDFSRDACYYLAKLIEAGLARKTDEGLYDVI